MTKYFTTIVLIALLLFLAAPVQGLSKKETVQAKKKITELQKDITRLKKKLSQTKNKQQRDVIIDKLNVEQAQVKKIKAKLYPKKMPAERVTVSFVTLEAGVEEEGLSYEADDRGDRRVARHLRIGAGARLGLFGDTTGVLAEVDFPARLIIGPATTAIRFSCGLTQNQEMTRRFVPVCFDLLLNFPAGYITGVENYIGAGLNYLALTTGRTQGTIGGEVFYGVESEGFGGDVFGEIGYSLMRTGFSNSEKGLTVMVGYKGIWALKQ